MKRINILLVTTLAFAGAASAQMQEYGNGQMGQQPGMGYTQPSGGYGNQGGFSGPGTTNLAALSGSWAYTIQGGRGPEAFQAQVDASGRFMARSPNTTLQGQFNGTSGQGMAVSKGQNGRPMQNRVKLQFDGQCHIQVTLLGKNGRPFGQGTVHVNHSPGAPCSN